MPPKRKWQWKDDAGNFKDFDAATNKTVEDLYVANDFCGTIKKKLVGKIVYGWYEYDFDAKTQKNEDSGKVRSIQRVDDKGYQVYIGVTPAAKWKWQDDKGTWHEYDDATTAELEKEYFDASVSDPTTTVKIGAFNYTIDFGAMVQINQASKKTRNMIRVGGKPPRVFSTKKSAATAADEDDEPPSKKSKTEAKSAITGGAKTKMIKKGRGVVDVQSGHADTCHVHDDGKVVWQCMLNQTNIGQNNNKYYVIQLLETDAAPSKYYFWTRWGRVGADGQSSNDPCNLAGGMSLFRKKFRDKTSNDWSLKDSFTKVPGKYQLMDMDYGSDDTKATTATASASAASSGEIAKSKLDVYLQALIKLISNKSGMESTMKELDIDVDKMPLGKISKKQIKEGFGFLKQIESELKTSSPSKVELQKFSSMFYTLIPHDFGFSLPPTIKSDDMLKRKMELLDVLSDLEIASTLLGKAKSSGANPVDHAYLSLNCPIQSIGEGSPTWKRIDKYMKNSHGKTHTMYTLTLTACYEVDRACEATRYKPYEKLHNKQMLWHGSRTTNFMGILSQGLRIAPPEAPVTGYMFGKGIYLADSSSKSANYCHCTPTSNEGVLVLCETALGTTKDYTKATYMDKPQPGTNSTMGLGKYVPDPKESEDVNGVNWPVGKLIDSAASTVLLYNEFIVYDVAQVKMKYLLKVRFNYGKKY